MGTDDSSLEADLNKWWWYKKKDKLYKFANSINFHLLQVLRYCWSTLQICISLLRSLLYTRIMLVCLSILKACKHWQSTVQMWYKSSVVKYESLFTVLCVCTTGGVQVSQAITPSVFMYQTPQGIVYAPATGPIQDKAIFSFQQPTQTLAVSQTDTPGMSCCILPVIDI